MSTLKTTNIAHPSSASNNIVLDSSGNVALQAGSASTPALQPTGDTNTGIFFPAADTIAFAEGGSEVMRIDSSSRLLIGTSSTSVTTTAIFQGNSGDGATGAGTIYLGRGVTTPSDGNQLGAINFSDSTHTNSAQVIAQRDGGTWSASSKPTRLVFSTCPNGSASPVERMRIKANGEFLCGGIYSFTTANGANVNIDSSGELRRSTSSSKYKTNIETIENNYSDALLNCRPVWYQSKSNKDNPDWGWWGFIAEEVAEIDPRLVHWKTTEPVVQENGSIENVPCDLEPEGVAYERFVPHLLNLIKRQKEQIEAMEARLSALEAS